MQLLPIIVLIGISLIGSLSNIGSGPTYALSKSATHDIRLVTSDYKIEYWVDEDTHSQMRRSYNTQAQVERAVLQDAIKELKRSCKQE